MNRPKEALTLLGWGGGQLPLSSPHGWLAYLDLYVDLARGNPLPHVGPPGEGPPRF